MDTVLGLVGLLALVGVPSACAIAQVRMLRRWTGAWRIAAGLPLPGWAIWGGNFARDVTSDPTSHNLFPFEVFIGASVALLYLGLLAAARRLAGTG
jgi:hypothetical protein